MQSINGQLNHSIIRSVVQRTNLALALLLSLACFFSGKSIGKETMFFPKKGGVRFPVTLKPIQCR
jgi:hypothetical protein